MKPRVLVVDDDASVRFTIRGVLEDADLRVEEAKDGKQALECLDNEEFDLVITDLQMPEVDGMELLRRLSAKPRRPQVLMITAHGSEKHAVAAVKAGAYDYVRKPFDIDELLAVVQRAIESVGLRAENERLHGELNLSRSLVFASPAMSRVAVLVARVAPQDVTVLITGETGTGKERVAEALVRASRRADKPFVRFNCASLGGELAEAELFGHSRGAFTGAHRARAGLFRDADGGTILLDEIGELDAVVQARLLRVLQEREIRPVGEDRPQKVDVRILAATHRDLTSLVGEGKFREDLFYRLNVVNIHIVPLRERPEDIDVLARHFFERFAARFGAGPVEFTPELERRILTMPWKGNVRELENSVERLIVLSQDGVLDLSLLGDTAVTSATELPPGLGLKERVEAYERGVIVQTLRATEGNRSETSRQLGITRVTLYEKLKKYGLGREDDEA